MTVYKALASYLKSKEDSSNLDYVYIPSVSAEGDVGVNYTNQNMCIWHLRNDSPEVTHTNGFKHGRASAQYDFMASNLTNLDTAVEKFKEHFVGRSIVLDSSVKMAYAETSNEFSDYDSKQKTYIRSIDLDFLYIITT